MRNLGTISIQNLDFLFEFCFRRRIALTVGNIVAKLVQTLLVYNSASSVLVFYDWWVKISCPKSKTMLLYYLLNPQIFRAVKFRYSERTTKFCEISIVDLTFTT